MIDVVAVHSQVLLDFFKVIHLSYGRLSFFAENLVFLLLPVHFFYLLVLGCKLLLESLAHFAHVGVVLELEFVDFVLVLLLQLVHLLLVLRSQLVHFAALLDYFRAKVVLDFVILGQHGNLLLKVSYFTFAEDEEFLEGVFGSIGGISVAIHFLGYVFGAIQKLVLQDFYFIVERYLYLILLLLNLHVIILQLFNLLVLHLTPLYQLLVLLLVSAHFGLKNFYVVLCQLQLCLSLSKIVVLLVNFLQYVVPILVKILQPLNLVLQLANLLVLHTRISLVVVALITLVILLQILNMRFKLLNLLALMINIILLLLQLKLQFLPFFLKFLDFELKIPLPCTLMPRTSTACINAARTLLSRRPVILLLELGINNALAVLFGVVALSCDVAEVLLRYDLIVLFFDVLLSQVVRVFGHYLYFDRADLGD